MRAKLPLRLCVINVWIIFIMQLMFSWMTNYDKRNDSTLFSFRLRNENNACVYYIARKRIRTATVTLTFEGSIPIFAFLINKQPAQTNRDHQQLLFCSVTSISRNATMPLFSLPGNVNVNSAANMLNTNRLSAHHSSHLMLASQCAQAQLQRNGNVHCVASKRRKVANCRPRKRCVVTWCCQHA